MTIKIQREAIIWYEEVYHIENDDSDNVCKSIQDCIDGKVEPISYELLKDTLEETGECKIFDKNYNPL